MVSRPPLAPASGNSDPCGAQQHVRPGLAAVRTHGGYSISCRLNFQEFRSAPSPRYLPRSSTHYPGSHPGLDLAVCTRRLASHNQPRAQVCLVLCRPICYHHLGFGKTCRVDGLIAIVLIQELHLTTISQPNNHPPNASQKINSQNIITKSTSHA